MLNIDIEKIREYTYLKSIFIHFIFLNKINLVQIYSIQNV